MEPQALAAALERNQTAGYIDLKENKIGDRGVQAGGVGEHSVR